MREIKFRAWDKEEKRMTYKIEAIYFNYMGGTTIVEEKHEGFIETDKKDGDFVLMQYTGFKDKNGREIYEGDIVKTESGGTFELIWNKNKARFMLLDAIISADDKLEVIGNIYENPKLMGG